MWNWNEAEESSLLWSTSNSWVFREVALENTSDALRGAEDVGHREIFSLNNMIAGNSLF